VTTPKTPEAETERPTNVVAALSAVMRELPGIGKGEVAAQQQGGYHYRGIEAITREVQPLFAKYGVVFAPRVVSHEVIDIEVNSKPWTDTRALIEYRVYGPGGIEDFITIGPLLAIGRDNSDKGGNKCATQAFKYALLQALCISDAKDDADSGSPEADARTSQSRNSGSTRGRSAAPMTGQDGEAISYAKLAPIDDRRDVAARFKSLPEDQRLALTETMREHKIPGPSQMSVEQVKFARALISAAAKTAVEGGYDYESALEDQRFEEAEARKATAPTSTDDPDFQARLESVKGNDFKHRSEGESTPEG
jgi:hypothetical protein